MAADDTKPDEGAVSVVDELDDDETWLRFALFQIRVYCEKGGRIIREILEKGEHES